MKHILWGFFKIFLAIIVFTGAYNWNQTVSTSLLPSSSEYAVPDESVRFYADYTYLDENGIRQTEQHIWDRVFALIDGASHYMLFDFFLFNDFQSNTLETTRSLSDELTDHIVTSRTLSKHMATMFITDPINTVYGGVVSSQQVALRKSGVIIMETNLSALRDSNTLWSSVWIPYFSWTGNSATGGIFPHPFQANGDKVALRSWAELLNFKANHRKLLVVDESIPTRGTEGGRKMITLVTSSNPHDASSAHGNIALEVRDSIWQNVIRSELSIAKESGGGDMTYNPQKVFDETGPIKVQLLSETQILETVLQRLRDAKQGDTFNLAMFYLSERDIINALIDASNRGAFIRVILDPNKDAFGHEKNGIPNRPVAKELQEKSNGGIAIRWCDTHGEQCHAKFFAGKSESEVFLMVGSANFTRRNIDGFNLETDIIASSDKPFTAWKDGEKYFERLWSNTNGTFTIDYAAYADDTIWKSLVYRFMEITGLSTF